MNKATLGCPPPDKAKQTDDTALLSTVVRARLTFAAQLRLDQGDIYTPERYEAFAEMANVAEKKRDEFVRSLLLFDAILILLSLGQSITVPGISTPLDQIPGIIEVVAVLSTFNFYYSTMSFYDQQLYDALLSQFDVRKVEYSGMDPELLTASKRFNHLHLKFAREKVNIWGMIFSFPDVVLGHFSGFNNVPRYS